MQTDLETIRDTFEIGYEAYEDSYKEAAEVWNLYHNRHFTQEQLNVLRMRGQPPETFNVIKMLARMLVGYFSTVTNTVVARPVNPRDTELAGLLNDTIKAVFDDNRFDMLGDQIKLSGLLTGVLACETNVRDSGERDQFNRPINEIDHAYVPTHELVFDPSAKESDYSDARFLHRHRWMSEDRVKKLLGDSAIEKLDAYYNTVNVETAEFDYANPNGQHVGIYRIHDNYLVVHTVIEGDDGKRWSVYWSGDVELMRTEITFRKAKWPYRIQFVHQSDQTEFYGLFREVIESQHSINQAVIRLQQLVNSEKVYAEDGAVDDMAEFEARVARVNAVVPVLKLSGIKVEKATAEAEKQYVILERAIDRIQRVLGINDSFLGMAFASDSGRKVKLQQNASVMSLRYVSSRIESFYRSLGEDTAYLIQQYFTANQVLAVSDEVTGDRYLELNKPMTKFTGQFDAQGNPIYQPIMQLVLNPDTQEPAVTEKGEVVYAPVSELETDFSYMTFKVRINSATFNDEDERAQLLLETVMSGQVGAMMSQINPAGFFSMAALSMKSMKTKYSPQIVEVLEQTAQMLGGNPEANAQASMMAQEMPGQSGQAMSKALKLPTNTNEDAV